MNEVDLETNVELLNKKIADLTEEVTFLKTKFKNFFIYECKVKVTSTFEQLTYTNDNIENNIQFDIDVKILHLQVFGSTTENGPFVTDVWIKKSANKWNFIDRDPSGEGVKAIAFDFEVIDNKLFLKYRTLATVNSTLNLIINAF